jgi:hypothetical protein
MRFFFGSPVGIFVSGGSQWSTEPSLSLEEEFDSASESESVSELATGSVPRFGSAYWLSMPGGRLSPCLSLGRGIGRPGRQFKDADMKA